jgi:hypothetical protein
MDGQRFDEVTKAFARGMSRRAVLRTALGSMGAGLLALTEIANAGAVHRRKNTIDVDELRSCIQGCKHLSGLARGQCLTACARGLNEVINKAPVRCGENMCGSGEYCCNESCGICAPIGGSCIQQFCGPS